MLETKAFAIIAPAVCPPARHAFEPVTLPVTDGSARLPVQLSFSMPPRPSNRSCSHTLADVRRLARRYTLIPITRTLLADLETPVSAYLKIAGSARQPYSYLLESVEGGENLGRYSYLGADPDLIIRQQHGKVETRRAGRWSGSSQSVIAMAREEVGRNRIAPVAGAPGFIAGGVGFFGYDMVRTMERLPDLANDDLDVDDALLMFFSRQVAFDHVRRQIVLIACVRVDRTWPKAARAARLAREYARAVADLNGMERRLRRPPVLPPRRVETTAMRLRANLSPAAYRRKVQQAKRYIAAGDVFQVVVSQRWDIPTHVPPFQVYRALRTVNPSPYMFFLRTGDLHVLGASPEMLVQVNGRDIQYRPIAGTRPRGADEAQDLRLAAELAADAKERAEHIMLVDLGRNDVGRVAEVGSVSVPRLMFVEKYSHVQHLVSDVRGRLRPELDMFDALVSCFPAGTMSGAPKVRAMEIIEELEPTRRGVYSGSVMYLDFSGNLNACIAIRTLVMRRGVAHLQVGAGIVADSVPQREHQECINKAGAVLRAIALARAGL